MLLFFNGNRMTEKAVITIPSINVSVNLNDKTISVCCAITAAIIKLPAESRKIPTLLRFVLKNKLVVFLKAFIVILFSANFAQVFLKPSDLYFILDRLDIIPDVLLLEYADSNLS